MVKCHQMGLCQIGNVYVISNASSIRRRVIVAVNAHGSTSPECCLDGDLDEMRSVKRSLTVTACRIGSCDVEIAKYHMTEPVGSARISKYLLRHQFRHSVR